MTADSDHVVLRSSRRELIKRLAAAGFAAPVIASILADGAWAQDAATPAAATPTALPELASPFTTIPPSKDAAESLKSIGIDQPLIAHGGFNFGTPPELVDGLDVDNEAFFIRSHGPSARLDDLSTYSLTVGGHVTTPLTLSLDDLKGMPQRTYEAFLECSGNGRGFFAPAAKGGQWRNDAIGNANGLACRCTKCSTRRVSRTARLTSSHRGVTSPRCSAGCRSTSRWARTQCSCCK
jgi:DMSO/TMAO reductase YedYZ molybdopterin-dependent catalytic subunit